MEVHLEFERRLWRLEQLIKDLSILQKEVLSLKEVCWLLDLTPSCLYKLTASKKIPHYCPGGKRIYFKASEIKAWLQAHRVPTNQEHKKQVIATRYSKKQNQKTL